MAEHTDVLRGRSSGSMIPDNCLSHEDNSTIACFMDEDYNESTKFTMIAKYFVYRASGIAPTQAHIQTIQDMVGYLESETPHAG